MATFRQNNGHENDGCSTLKMLIENHEPVNLIDIRPKKEFREWHIIGARSLPFATCVDQRFS